MVTERNLSSPVRSVGSCRLVHQKQPLSCENEVDTSPTETSGQPSAPAHDPSSSATVVVAVVAAAGVAGPATVAVDQRLRHRGHGSDQLSRRRDVRERAEPRRLSLTPPTAHCSSRRRAASLTATPPPGCTLGDRYLGSGGWPRESDVLRQTSPDPSFCSGLDDGVLRCPGNGGRSETERLMYARCMHSSAIGP